MQHRISSRRAGNQAKSTKAEAVSICSCNRTVFVRSSYSSLGKIAYDIALIIQSYHVREKLKTFGPRAVLGSKPTSAHLTSGPSIWYSITAVVHSCWAAWQHDLCSQLTATIVSSNSAMFMSGSR